MPACRRLALEVEYERIRTVRAVRFRIPAAEYLGRTEDMRYYLGLGSNLGEPRANLADARRRLAANGIRVRKISSLYRTEPVGISGQPWYLNQTVQVEADLSPRRLLSLVKRLEAEMGRTPGARNAPRVIDIDILLAGQAVVDTPALTVPHPRLAERNFELVPLAKIAPRTIHPLLRKTIRTLLRASSDRSWVEKVPSRLKPRRPAS